MFGALSFEHDSAVGFVADPTCDVESVCDSPSADTETDTLDSALEDDALTGHHKDIVDDFGPVRVRFGGQNREAFGIMGDRRGEFQIDWRRSILRLEFFITDCAYSLSVLYTK